MKAQAIQYTIDDLQNCAHVGHIMIWLMNFIEKINGLALRHCDNGDRGQEAGDGQDHQFVEHAILRIKLGQTTFKTVRTSDRS